MPLCPNCEDYEGDWIGSHWQRSKSCSYPEPTQYQKEILTGMLMGDGYIDTSNKSPRMKLDMINKKFLEWFDQEMGIFTTGVRLNRTAAESFSNMENADFITPTRVENYHDVHRLYTRSIPWLQTLERWYNSGSKRFPDNLSLTPEIAKIWYVSDGGLYMGNVQSGYAEIYTSNESDRGDYLEDLFQKVGFDVKFSSGTIRFSTNETQDFLDWIGSPPPGFEYKWEIDDFDEYRRLKERAYDQ